MSPGNATTFIPSFHVSLTLTLSLSLSLSLYIFFPSCSLLYQIVQLTSSCTSFSPQGKKKTQKKVRERKKEREKEKHGDTTSRELASEVQKTIITESQHGRFSPSDPGLSAPPFVKFCTSILARPLKSMAKST